MRPRLIAVDDAVTRQRSRRDGGGASMRPRLIAVDDNRAPRLVPRRNGASMRPRLIAVDDELPMCCRQCAHKRFNEATADRRG